MKRLLKGPQTGVAQEPCVATHQPSVSKASPASVPTAMLMSACVLLQTRKSAWAGEETITSRAKAKGRRENGSLAPSALEFTGGSLRCASSPLVGEDRGGGAHSTTRLRQKGGPDNLVRSRG